MMKVQLKAWQRYGIAVSVAWIIGVTSYVRYQELPKAQEYATHAYFVCSESKRAMGQSGIDACLKKVEDDWDDWMNRQWGRIAWISLLPVSVGWLVVCAGLFVHRKLRPAKSG